MIPSPPLLSSTPPPSFSIPQNLLILWWYRKTFGCDFFLDSVAKKSWIWSWQICTKKSQKLSRTNLEKSLEIGIVQILGFVTHTHSALLRSWHEKMCTSKQSIGGQYISLMMTGRMYFVLNEQLTQQQSITCSILRKYKLEVLWRWTFWRLILLVDVVQFIIHYISLICLEEIMLIDEAD